MEITTFELLVKRIAPPPASPTVARRVVQGYFLTISNLEDRDYTFNLDFHVSRPTPPDADRTLAGNAEVFYDIAGANTPLPLVAVNPSPLAPTFTTRFVLPAKQTASLQVLPKLSNPGLLTDANPDLEVRGFVRLRLPALRGRFPFFPTPQSNRPVKVLLNPEVRGTFLPNEFPAAGGDFDQINYPLTLASGKALNEIEPERAGLVQVSPDVITNLVDNLPLREQPTIDFAALSPEGRSEALAEVIAQVEPTPENLQNISDLLSKLEIPVRMERVVR